jgi:SWI/SNF-related matrix-associated actin-dependent regulator of chromatin subfamily B protein 1
MRYAPVDRNTNEMLRADHGGELPVNMKYQWLPRIKCNDCPGKLYQAGPSTTVENFEIHLRNRQHKERREGRENKSKIGS